MYGLRARTLARRGTPVPRWRIAAFAGAVVLFVVALSPPLEHRAEELFVFHMIQHVLLGDLAPLLFVLGLTGPLLRPLLALRPVAALRRSRIRSSRCRSGRSTSTSGTCPTCTRARSETTPSTRSST